MSITTIEGIVLTDEMLDEMAAEYENGTWRGELVDITPGRPRISDEELTTLSFKIPESRIAAIERVTKSRRQSKSQFLREAVDRALLSAAVL